MGRLKDNLDRQKICYAFPTNLAAPSSGHSMHHLIEILNFTPRNFHPFFKFFSQTVDISLACQIRAWGYRAAIFQSINCIGVLHSSIFFAHNLIDRWSMLYFSRTSFEEWWSVQFCNGYDASLKIDRKQTIDQMDGKSNKKLTVFDSLQN